MNKYEIMLKKAEENYRKGLISKGQIRAARKQAQMATLNAAYNKRLNK